MTRTERALAHRWRSVLMGCALVVLTGAVLVIWSRIDASDSRAHQMAAEAERLAAEAERRGDAVATLAGDVRVLRAQIEAKGGKPKAPEPERAVEDLPDRERVPVPIPGPRGPAGPQGAADDGEDGQDGADSTVPGPAGPPGQDGADSTVPGPAGPAGPQGPPGEDGKDGKDGQTCPDGYSLQPPADDPDALVCRRDGAPEPEPEPGPGPEPQASGSPAAVLDRRRL